MTMGQRLRCTSVFAVGENLGVGGIHFTRAFKIIRVPIVRIAHNGKLGDVAEYPGMKAFFNLK